MQSEGGKLETRVNLTHFRAQRHELRWNNDRIHPDPGLIICSTLSELMMRVIWLRVMRLFVMTFVPGIRMVTMRHWWWWGDICSPGSGCSQWPGIGSCPRCHNAATGLLSSPHARVSHLWRQPGHSTHYLCSVNCTHRISSASNRSQSGKTFS